MTGRLTCPVLSTKDALEVGTASVGAGRWRGLAAAAEQTVREDSQALLGGRGSDAEARGRTLALLRPSRPPDPGAGPPRGAQLRHRAAGGRHGHALRGSHGQPAGAGGTGRREPDLLLGLLGALLLSLGGDSHDRRGPRRGRRGGSAGEGRRGDAPRRRHGSPRHAGPGEATRAVSLIGAEEGRPGPRLRRALPGHPRGHLPPGDPLDDLLRNSPGHPRRDGADRLLSLPLHAS